MRTRIIYEDTDIIVAHKPAGLATQTSRVGQADMVSELKNYAKTPYLGVIHRLDQPVEGILVFGRTKEAAADLSRQLSAGLLNKRYYAVVCGQPVEQLLTEPPLARQLSLEQPLTGQSLAESAGRLSLEQPLTEQPLAEQSLAGRLLTGQPLVGQQGELVDYLYKKSGSVSVKLAREGGVTATGKEEKASDICVEKHLKKGIHEGERAEIVPEDQAASVGAKKAILHYCILESNTQYMTHMSEKIATLQSDENCDRKQIFLVDISIETGRFHQIRAQMSHAGMPLLGDSKYGDALSRDLSAKLHVKNVALCAYELEFVHPSTREKMSFHIAPGQEIFNCFHYFET